MNDARRLWALAEPLHALTYFAPESQAAAAEVGLRGFWNGYFAFRAAPLGPVGAEVVTATFVNFEPSFVARRVPGVWTTVTPAAALAARLSGVDAAVRRVLGQEWVGSSAAIEAMELAATAAAAVDPPGRPLAAANAGLTVPPEPHLVLWQALTTLREHRGDGHTAVLLAHEVDGLGSHVLAAAAGRADRAWLQKARGWDDPAWEGAAAALADRGWLAGDRLTAAGQDAVAGIEAGTDRLAAGPWRALGESGCRRLAELLDPLRRAVVDAGDWPAGNPIGVPEPGD
ncbi:SCO6745 family protein [Blastococcus sp. SYSU DS0616]